MPGATMVYYGTEIPLEGGYDPDSRRCFDWNADGAFAQKVKKLLGYKKLRALAEGGARFYGENGLFVVERKANGQTATLLVNNTKDKLTARGQTVSADGHAVIVE